MDEFDCLASPAAAGQKHEPKRLNGVLANSAVIL